MPLLTLQSAKGYGFGKFVSASTSDYVFIETQEVGSGGASYVEFTSISGSYKHLEIRLTAKLTDTASDGGSWFIRPNNDTTAGNYVTAGVYGQRGGADDFAQYFSPSDAGLIPWWNLATSKTGSDDNVGAGLFSIFDYASTNKHKTMIYHAGWHIGTTAQQSYQIVIWESTNAITSLRLTPNGSNFAQYSKFDLYGVK